VCRQCNIDDAAPRVCRSATGQIVVHEVAQQRIALYCVLVVRLDSEPLDTVCDGERLQPSRWKIRSTGTNIARRLWDQREQLRGEYEDVQAPTGRCGRSSIRVSCLMRCSLVRTGRAWAASGSMCEVTGWATPTGSNEPLYGRTNTKSPMVHSSMVPVAGGKGGSIRHDDDGRPAPSGGSPASAGRGVFHFDDYRIESIQVGIIEVVETDDDSDDD
jgi:hypothetical protein